MENKKTEELLEAILQELTLLTVSTKATALQRFNKEFLISEMRRKAYELFDGTKTLKEISEHIGEKQNSVQIFAQQLVAKDLLAVTKQGNNKMYSKSITKIAVYYAAQDLKKEEVNNG